MRRLICAAILLILVGCAAVPSVPIHPQTERAAIKSSGGAFSAQYSGSYGLSVCSTPQTHGTFQFSGSGTGTFIHASTEQGTMYGAVFSGCNWNGSATLRNSTHPGNSISMSLSLAKGVFHFNTPCDTQGKKIVFTVSGGTGKFALATGSGTVVFGCGNGTYTDKWSGTITF